VPQHDLIHRHPGDAFLLVAHVLVCRLLAAGRRCAPRGTCASPKCGACRLLTGAIQRWTLWRRFAQWHSTFCSLAKVAIFTTNVDAENQTLINHKCVCGALNRHFCETPVTGWHSRSCVCQ
jgi:hypothetical protein